ncbi:hypothetical protein M2271_004974 [Streptomyces sp. LBL]|uniref:hypothetical protein n=1 Tax=Streptomyces sp. LBL TaxID=2940562 RepID=UPI00247634B4|nr:hypothetical protein [Streptomyces sp. LBL]MDH6627150.1 hypothetical protein [Streptomyces sp. LBL]
MKEVDPTFVAQLAGDSLVQSMKEDKVIKALAAWSSCIDGKGHAGLADPYKAMDQGVTNDEEPSQESIALAVDDIDCKKQTDLVKIWSDVESVIQDGQIADNNSRPTSIKDAAWQGNRRRAQAAGSFRPVRVDVVVPGPFMVRALCLMAACVLAAGCTDDAADNTPASRRSPTPSAEQSSPHVRPSPVASVHSEGRTRVLEYGDLIVRATPESSGVRTEIEVANTYQRKATYPVQISIADGEGWTAHNRFWLQDVPPGKTRRDDAVIGSEGMGPVPQVPKIYVDEFTPLVDRK